ncbi:phage portal protein [Embleya hyalina]|uniref:Chromosome partitioning protein ParA n=1 Tax=Embleya hyalina TaxID=516124 RepID=A0A401YYZ3_9ACTN|nr:phage portal protein [Embleya hyalina]GCD99854.1 chromosome partitioning protein ParA [Embleya hyalina]
MSGAFDSPPDSPEQWIRYLQGKLLSSAGRFKALGDYYDGEHQKLVFAQARHKEQFASLFNNWSDNFTGLIVDSVNERLAIDGFRMTEELHADKAASEIWQRNFMDAESNAAHLDALIHGVSYAIVWADKDGRPTITIESAEHVVVQYRPGSRREIEAAAKFYVDDWGRTWSTLWLPNGVYTFQEAGQTWRQAKRARNPTGVVPVVPISNRSRLTGKPLSDLRGVIPLQDAINKIVSDALVASEFMAWPQRFVTGLEILEDEDGRPVEPFQVAVDKLLQAEDPNAKFGQFEAADLSNYCDLVAMLVQHMASISRIPFHYFLLNGGQAPSGEAITSAEAGLISKVRERMLHFGEAWERVLRLCFAVMGDKKRAEAWSAEVMWRDPENRTEAQHMDALMKLSLIGVPRNQLLADAGYSPQQIERFKSMREDDAKDEMELARKYPAPVPAEKETPGDEKTQVASKSPQGNAGNAAREAA